MTQSDIWHNSIIVWFGREVFATIFMLSFLRQFRKNGCEYSTNVKMHVRVDWTDEIVSARGWTAFSGQARVNCCALQNTFQLANVFSIEFLTAAVRGLETVRFVAFTAEFML